MHQAWSSWKINGKKNLCSTIKIWERISLLLDSAPNIRGNKWGKTLCSTNWSAVSNPSGQAAQQQAKPLSHGSVCIPLANLTMINMLSSLKPFSFLSMDIAIASNQPHTWNTVIENMPISIDLDCKTNHNDHNFLQECYALVLLELWDSCYWHSRIQGKWNDGPITPLLHHFLNWNLIIRPTLLRTLTTYAPSCATDR